MLGSSFLFEKASMPLILSFAAPEVCFVPCELRAPEDFPKRRYNLLDMSVMRVAYYELDSWLFSL